MPGGGLLCLSVLPRCSPSTAIFLRGGFAAGVAGKGTGARFADAERESLSVVPQGVQ
jgi:hypothetical protein